jgi:hypothetical protein
MKQPELSMCPGHCLSIVLGDKNEEEETGDIESCGDSLAGGSRFLTLAAKVGSALSSLVAGNKQDNLVASPRSWAILFLSPISLPLFCLSPNAMLKSAKSVVSAVGAYKQLHTMPLNGIASASHTITNLKRWSVAGKELPGT